MADEKQEPTPKTQQTKPAKGKPIEIPLAKRADWDRLLRRATDPRKPLAKGN
jgi:hypothetical protein